MSNTIPEIAPILTHFLDLDYKLGPRLCGVRPNDGFCSELPKLVDCPACLEILKKDKSKVWGVQ